MFKIIGKSFPEELQIAGLGPGLSFTIGGTESDILGRDSLDSGELVLLEQVIANHIADKPTPDDIKVEAQRRINALFGATELNASLVKQMNTQKRATALIFKQVSGQMLTPDEQAEIVSLNALGETIDAIREASNALEQSLPADFIDNKYWP